jgi:signal transduction histidine kinase
MPVKSTALQSVTHRADNDLEASASRRPAHRRQQGRHTVAEWLDAMSLSGRLSLFVALIVICVVTGVLFLEMRAFERDIDAGLVDAARLGAETAAATLSDRPEPLDPLDAQDALHDLAESDPLINAVSVVEGGADGVLRIITSTSTEERAEVLDLARRALTVGPASQRGSTVVMFAAPVPRRPRYAVVVTVGLETLLQARAHGLRVALGFAIPTMLLVTALVHLTVRRFVTTPLGEILQTMEATAAGETGARASVLRGDEIGTIATGLNRMLDQLERSTSSLQKNVEEATRDLSLRNAQLAASHEELFSARESLAHAERVAALGQVAASVAHQAGTPLNLVSGYVQMIREDPKTDDRTRLRLQTVDRQIQHVARVLRALLDSSRPPSGFEIVRLADVIERLREVANPRLSRSQIRLETSIDPALPLIRADVTQLEMALLNLMTNALDAMPGGGTLSISATTVPDGVRVEVSDTGPGIAAEILDRLFVPWVTTKPAGQGSGLGLAIVRDVVRAHGGAVSARNQAVGAAFVIDLPTAEGQLISA